MVVAEVEVVVVVPVVLVGLVVLLLLADLLVAPKSACKQLSVGVS